MQYFFNNNLTLKNTFFFVLCVRYTYVFVNLFVFSLNLLYSTLRIEHLDLDLLLRLLQLKWHLVTREVCRLIGLVESTVSIQINFPKRYWKSERCLRKAK